MCECSVEAIGGLSLRPFSSNILESPISVLLRSLPSPRFNPIALVRTDVFDAPGGAIVGCAVIYNLRFI